MTPARPDVPADVTGPPPHGDGAAPIVPVRKGLPWMLLGAGVAGAAAYAFQVLGARVLGDEAYAPIGVLWTLHYLLITIFLYGIETFVTREVAGQQDRDRLPEPLRHKLVLLLVAASPAAAALAYLASDVLFPARPSLAVVVGAMVAAHGAFFIVRGLLAGSSRFRGYGIVTALETISRLGLAGVAVALIPTTEGFAWTFPAGGLVAASAWFLVARSPLSAAERSARAATRRDATGAGRFLLVTSVANAAAQLLLAGGPLALAVMEADAGDISVFFITITAARVPIVLAFGGVLSRVLPAFTSMREQAGPAALNRVALAIGGAAAVLALLAAAIGAWIGPTLIALLFGPSFEPSAFVAGGAGATVLLASGGLFLNQVLVAQRAERRLLLPWYLGLAAAILIIVLAGGSPVGRVMAGVVAGEALALGGLVVASLRPKGAGTRDVAPG